MKNSGVIASRAAEGETSTQPSLASQSPDAAPRSRTAGSANAAIRRFADSLLDPDGAYAEVFDNLILVLIVVSVASIAIEAIPDLPPLASRAFGIAEVVIVTVFSLEYLLRIVAARKRLAFIFSYAGIVDLLAIAPFYVAGVDTRWLRALRMLRLLRLLKLQTHVLEGKVASRTRELAEKNASLEAAQAQLKAELEVARALQIAILPASFPARPGCDGAARMIPATTMGGDFYDFIELPSGEIGLVMADVSGHGVPAAFFMGVARTHLRDLAAQHADPGACLGAANDRLCGQNPLDLFVTVFYCMLEPTTGALRYANGGQNPPYLQRTDGSVVALDGTGGLALGALPGVEFPNHEMQLQPGDRLVLYTDGVTEAFNTAGEAYGTQRLVEELSAQRGGSAATLLERISTSVMTFAGAAPQSDDITIAVLNWKAP